MGARRYDPVLGRFISADTIIPSHQRILALSRYTYVNNTTKVIVFLFALFAEIERGFIFSQDKGSAGCQESTKDCSWKA